MGESHGKFEIIIAYLVKNWIVTNHTPHENYL